MRKRTGIRRTPGWELPLPPQPGEENKCENT
nr:MAG TPA_asm: hypothetical protein [Caudoviricetes sp.]